MKIIVLVLFIVFLLYAYMAHGASATLNWTDNADNEEGFNINRNLNGGAFSVIGAVKANITTYVDPTMVAPPAVTAPAPAPKNTYCYTVTTWNHGAPVPPATTGPLQVSGPSNQACADILGTVNPAPVTVPAAATNLTATPSSQLRAAPQTKGKTRK